MNKKKRKRKSPQKPPAVVNGIRVLYYSFIPPDLKYSGHSFLFVDGQEIGPVPRLIIGEPMRHKDVVLLHCDKNWNVRGIAGGYKSVTDAKIRAERIYPGIARSWLKSAVPKSKAVVFERKIWRADECSFCGKIPPEFDMWVHAKKAVICNLCITKYHNKFMDQ